MRNKIKTMTIIKQITLNNDNNTIKIITNTNNNY